MPMWRTLLLGNSTDSATAALRSGGYSSWFYVKGWLLMFAAIVEYQVWKLRCSVTVPMYH